jgi:hypothetical protein
LESRMRPISTLNALVGSNHNLAHFLYCQIVKLFLENRDYFREASISQSLDRIDMGPAANILSSVSWKDYRCCCVCGDFDGKPMLLLLPV